MKNPDKKAEYVHKVFEKIARKYDVMNNIISFGLHKRWKEATIKLSKVNLAGARVIDIGCGTGDYLELVIKLSNGDIREAVGIDFSERMLNVASARLKGYLENGKVKLFRADASCLDFLEDSAYSLITCGFTLRNVANINAVLGEAYKKLKCGGVFVSLDLARPVPPLIRPFSYFYARVILPVIASVVASAKEEYVWLFESLKSFPTKSELAQMMKDAGFSNVNIFPFGLGVACAHIAYKNT